MTIFNRGDHAIRLIRRRRGTMARIASALGLRGATVQRWATVPLEYVFDVSKIIQVPVERLRPDFFMKDPTRAGLIPAWRLPKTSAVPAQRSSHGRTARLPARPALTAQKTPTKEELRHDP